MFCSKCGEDLNDSTFFCPKCGTKVEEGNVFTQDQTVSPSNDLLIQTKTNLKVFLLWFFLGFFGGHCFYIGKKTLGKIHIGISVGFIISFFLFAFYDNYEALFIALLLLLIQLILWIVGLVIIIKFFRNQKLMVKDDNITDKIPSVSLKNMLYKALRVVLVSFIAVLIVNQFIGIAITVKPWYERLWITIVGGSTLGLVGAGIGATIGGIGIAFMGTGVGIPAALALGCLGFIAGSSTGSIVTLIANPEFYDISIVKLTLLIVIAVTIGFISVSILLGVFKRLRVWLINNRK
jgi:hypothetical protein